MKKYLFTIFTAILLSIGSINATTANVADFDSIFVNIPTKVVVIKGDTCSVTVRATNGMSKYVTFNVEDNTLNITSEYTEMLKQCNESIKVIITTPFLPNIKAGKDYDLIDNKTNKINNVNETNFA